MHNNCATVLLIMVPSFYTFSVHSKNSFCFQDMHVYSMPYGVDKDKCEGSQTSVAPSWLCPYQSYTNFCGINFTYTAVMSN